MVKLLFSENHELLIHGFLYRLGLGFFFVEGVFLADHCPHIEVLVLVIFCGLYWLLLCLFVLRNSDLEGKVLES